MTMSRSKQIQIDSKSFDGVGFFQRFIGIKETQFPKCLKPLEIVSVNQQAQCKHCGAIFEIRVSAVRAHLASLMVLLVSLSLSFGDGSFFLLLAMMVAPSSWWVTHSANLILMPLSR